MTNGINTTAVLSALNRLGWVNPTEDGYGIVNSDNQTSSSGRYYNDNSFHSACTIQNLYDCQADNEISDAEFNTFLTELRKAVQLSAINQVFDKPQLIDAPRHVFTRCDVNSRPVNIPNTSQFIGVRLAIAQGAYAVNLHEAILHFDDAATFKLYLFNDQYGEVENWDVTVEAGVQKKVTLDYQIAYSSTNYEGGAWYLGYFQDELDGAQAIRFPAYQNSYCKVVKVEPVSSAVSGAEPDYYSRNIYTEQYGLNLKLSTHRDLTDQIVTNAHLFDELQGLLMAAKVIEIVCNTTRSNAVERIGKANLSALYKELNEVVLETPMGNAVKNVPSLKAKIASEVKRVKEGFFPKPGPVTITCP